MTVTGEDHRNTSKPYRGIGWLWLNQNLSTSPIPPLPQPIKNHWSLTRNGFKKWRRENNEGLSGTLYRKFHWLPFSKMLFSARHVYIKDPPPPPTPKVTGTFGKQPWRSVHLLRSLGKNWRPYSVVLDVLICKALLRYRKTTRLTCH